MTNSPAAVANSVAAAAGVADTTLRTDTERRNAPDAAHVPITNANGGRVVVSDKKKDDEHHQHQHQRFASPTSPQRQILQPIKHQNNSHTHHAARVRSTSADNHKQTATSAAVEVENKNPSAASPTYNSTSPTSLKKLVPSVSVSMKQNLSELYYNGGIVPSSAATASSQHNNSHKDVVTSITSTVSTGGGKSTKSNGHRHQQQQHHRGRSSRPQTIDCTSSLAEIDVIDDEISDLDYLPVPRLRSSTLRSDRRQQSPGSPSEGRARKGGSASGRQNKDHLLDLSPVPKTDSSARHHEDRDKSSKRKSNLNRCLNEEPAHDVDDVLAATRRRRRRELGMSRPLIPVDDMAVREFISPQKTISSSTFVISSDKPPVRRDGSISAHGADHVRSARAMDRRRAQTTSPKIELARLKQEEHQVPKTAAGGRVSRRSDTLPLGLPDPRKRSNDVNRKVNERTKSDLAEIMKIVEMANEGAAPPKSSVSSDTLSDYDLKHSQSSADAFLSLNTSINRIRASHERELLLLSGTDSYESGMALPNSEARDSSPLKQTKFSKEELIYYEPDAPDDEFPLEPCSSSSGSLLRQRVLKARSVDRDAGHELPQKFSPILRRKSTDDPTVSSIATATPSMNAPLPPGALAQNHIVSILKKKDHIAGESSSASSNASPVTFSATVVDPPRHKRAGILKKRSSLDESRYYSRSHSPDERSILVKSARRNSLEEMAAASTRQHHGILKQSSYDSNKSDGCPSATEAHPPSILKKKDSTSTPSDGGGHGGKHVSISQAVILAAAELGRQPSENADADYDEGATPSNEEYEIRPILKTESTSSDEAPRPPKPILKKKSSGDSDEHEIRPILKTSRKSSREEFDVSGAPTGEVAVRHFSEPSVRPILKTDSPSKRRSLVETEGDEDRDEESTLSPMLFKRRTRSLERHDTPVLDLAAALNAIATSQASAMPISTSSQPATSTSDAAASPPSLTVAERVKNMELFLNSSGRTPGSNASWDASSGAVPKILKPSATRRHLYRDRFKTQPVTDDEKSYFKAATTFDVSTPTSAFTPAKSFEALSYRAIHQYHPQEQLSVPPTVDLTGNPNGTYVIARSHTQPIPTATTTVHKLPLHPHLHPHPHTHPRPPSPPLTPHNRFGSKHRFNSRRIQRNYTPQFDEEGRRYADHDDEEFELNPIEDNSRLGSDFDTTLTNSEQLNQTQSFSVDSERIFEMSALDESHSVDAAGGAAVEIGSGAADGAGGVGDAELPTKSVKARANLFQQMHGERQTTEREERTPATNRKTPTPSSASPAPTKMPSEIENSSADKKVLNVSETSASTANSSITDAREEEEIEPSSLPLAERLRFFSEIANRSKSSDSYQRPFSSTKDRSVGGAPNTKLLVSTPTSNNTNTSCTYSSGSGSANTTPRAPDCGSSTPRPWSLTPTTSTAEMMSIVDSPAVGDGKADNQDKGCATGKVKLLKSNSIVMSCIQEFEAMPRSANNINQMPPTAYAMSVDGNKDPEVAVSKHVRLKTMGKIAMPQTLFFNDRNNNNDSSDMNIPCAKKIGKIRSPFIDGQTAQRQEAKCMRLDRYGSIRLSTCEYDELESVSDNNGHEQQQNHVDSPAYCNSINGEVTAPTTESRLCLNNLDKRKLERHENQECSDDNNDNNDSNADNDDDSIVSVGRQCQHFNRLTSRMNFSPRSTVRQESNSNQNHVSTPTVPDEVATQSTPPTQLSAAASTINKMAKFAKFFGVNSNEFQSIYNIQTPSARNSRVPAGLVGSQTRNGNSPRDEAAQHLTTPLNGHADSQTATPRPAQVPRAESAAPTPSTSTSTGRHEHEKVSKFAKFFGLTSNEFDNVNSPNAAGSVSRSRSRSDTRPTSSASSVAVSASASAQVLVKPQLSEMLNLDKLSTVVKPAELAKENDKLSQVLGTTSKATEDASTPLTSKGPLATPLTTGSAGHGAQSDTLDHVMLDNVDSDGGNAAIVNKNIILNEKLRMLTTSLATSHASSVAHRRREIMKRRTVMAISSNSSIESTPRTHMSKTPRNEAPTNRYSNQPNCGLSNAQAMHHVHVPVVDDLNLTEIADYDDIIVTEEELLSAHDQFRSLQTEESPKVDEQFKVMFRDL